MSTSINVDTNKDLPRISRHIYGHFAEHLGRGVYGGWWVGKNSPVPNVNGFNKAVLEAFKAIKIPNLRWPGGCFADGYHWKDGVGQQRRRHLNTIWGGVLDDNSFGTHEFLELCELLDCAPCICGNVGSGTVQEMSEWVEYITFTGESPMAALRTENGHPAPWRLPFFGIGNENWGCGGNMRAEYYADLYRRYQTYVRQYGPDKVYKIASGGSGHRLDWTETLMREAAEFMDGLSLHHYTLERGWHDKPRAAEFDEDGWFTLLKNALYIEEIIHNHSAIMDRYDPARRVGLIIDEWGCWHGEENANPSFLYQQNTLRDALVAGVTLNIFNAHAERIHMANIAQAVNVLQSPVLTEGSRVVLTPTWHVFAMYAAHQDARLLKTALTTPTYHHKDASLPRISISASCSDAGFYTITLCNIDPQQSETSEIVFDKLAAPLTRASAEVLSAETMNAMNTFDAPEQVTRKTLSVEITGANTLRLIAPAKSLIAVTVA